MMPGLMQSNHLHFMDKKEALKEIITIFVNAEVSVDPKDQNLGYLKLNLVDYEKLFSICRNIFERHFAEVIRDYSEIFSYYGIIYTDRGAVLFKDKSIVGIFHG